MSGTLHVALQDLRLQVVDKAAVFFMLLMPLGFIFFFGTVFRDRGGPESVTVSLPVVNEDQDFLSVALVEQLRGESFDVDVYDAVAADTTTFDTRVVRVPAGFTRDVLTGKKAVVGLTKQAESSVTYDAAASIRLHQAQVRFLGNLIRWNPPAPEAEGIPPDLPPEEKGRFLALVGEPAKVTVTSSHAGRGRPVPQGMGQSVPGMLAMFVVMTVLIGGSEAITKEKRLGTLRRLATTTLSRGQILGGKLGGLVLLGVVQAGMLIAVTEIMGRTGALGMDFVWGAGVLPLAPLLVAYAFCVGSIALFISGLFRTTQQAESLSWLLGMVFAGLGGCWWPLEIVPDVFKTVGHLFPTAWAMDGLHGVITWGHGFAGVITPTLVLLLYGTVFAVVGARVMRVTD